MKRLMLLLFSVSIFSIMYAQVHWNVRGAVGAANLSGIDLDSHYTYQGGVGILSYKVGVGAYISFSEKWALQPVLNFASKGSKVSASYGNEQLFEGMLMYKLYYMELPIFVAYKLQMAQKVSLIFKAGPYIGYGLSGKASFSASDNISLKETFKGNLFQDGCDYGGITYIDDKNLKTTALNRFDAGVALGAEMNINHILFGVEGTFGLSPVSSNLLNSKPKNVALYLTLGYQF